MCRLCPPFLGTAGAAQDIVILMFGNRWVSVAPVLAWLAAGGFVSVLLSYNDTVFMVRGRPIWSFYVSAIYTLLAVVGFSASARLGSTYLAVPFVAPFLVTLPVSAWLVTLLTRVTFRDWLRATSSPVGAACLMLVVVMLLGNALDAVGNTMRLVALCVTGALVYVSTLMLFGRNTTRAILELLFTSRPKNRVCTFPGPQRRQ